MTLSVLLENGSKQPAHLADMRSRGGFSGSPVFIYRTPSGNLSAPLMHRIKDHQPTGYSGSQHRTRKEWFVGLLGIHCGQFWETIEVRKDNSKNERRGDPIVEGDKLSIQGGMTIVAPAWRITDLLDSQAFEALRRQREPEMQSEREKRPRAEKAEQSDLPASDENPSHREDFMRLLGAAARQSRKDD